MRLNCTACSNVNTRVKCCRKHRLSRESCYQPKAMKYPDGGANLLRVKGGITKVVGRNSQQRNRKLPPPPFLFVSYDFFYTSGKTIICSDVRSQSRVQMNEFSGKWWRTEWLEDKMNEILLHDHGGDKRRVSGSTKYLLFLCYQL